MACLKQIWGEKRCAHSEQRKKHLKEENYTLKGKGLSLKGDLQEKTLICCGAVSKDVFNSYGVWLEVQSTCIDFNGRKNTH